MLHRGRHKNVQSKVEKNGNIKRFCIAFLYINLKSTHSPLRPRDQNQRTLQCNNICIFDLHKIQLFKIHILPSSSICAIITLHQLLARNTCLSTRARVTKTDKNIQQPFGEVRVLRVIYE